MKKINWYYFIPVFVLLFAPWIHKMFFENFMLAFPEASSAAVHVSIAAVCLLSIWLFSFLYLNKRS